jgi:chromosome segregation ATPase
MNGVIKTHQEELLALRKTVSLKQKTLSESESNLTTIGTYVDKLEERLTSFAITRRDMEERERQCKQIEEAANVTESERKALQVKVDEYAKEQEGLKRLLEELASERASLQKDNRKLLTEREFRIGEQESLQENCASLETEVKALANQAYEFRSKCEALEPDFEAAKESNRLLQSRVEGMSDLEKELEASRSKNAEIQEHNERIQMELQSVREEKVRLEAAANNAIARLAEHDKQVEEKRLSTPLPTQSLPPSAEPRNVPFRSLRKKLSKATGMHGLLTPSSKITRREKGAQPNKGQWPSLPRVQKVGVLPKGQQPPPPPLPSEQPN